MPKPNNKSLFSPQGPAKSQQPATNEFTEKTGRRFNKVSWVEEGEYLPLNVSYQLLAGKPSTQESK